VERSDAGRPVSTEERKMRVAGMKVDDIERLGFLQYLRKLKRVMRLRLNDFRIETKGAVGASDQATFRLRVTTCEQGYLVAASDKLVREIGHDPFGPTISNRRNRFSKR